MFADKRSKKLIILAHCVLNQNAKLDRCAHYPGAMEEVIGVVVASGTGIVQLPCPELMCLGLDRQADGRKSASVAEEDTRIARRMAKEEAAVLCHEVARSLVFQIEEYQKHGFTMVGLIGINGSPTCGVETTWYDDREQAGSGVLIKIIREALEKKSLSLTMHGIKAYEPEKATAAVIDLLNA